MKIVKSYVMKCCGFDGTSIETETTWSEFTNGGKAIVEQIASEEINKSVKRPWNHDHEDDPNQHENSQKLCDEMRHPVVNFMEHQ